MPRYSTAPRSRRRGVAVAAALLAVAGTGPAFADVTPDPLRVPAQESGQTLARNVLAKAAPDECFYGADAPIGPISSDGTCPPLSVDGQTLTGQPKVNQAYLWGLTRANRSLWFGTVANVPCLAVDAIAGLVPSLTSLQTASWVCQPNTTIGGVAVGDFRPPRLYRYDETTDQLIDIDKTMPSEAQRLLRQTLGIRSAGTARGVVFLAGPSVGGGIVGGGGINLFAFNASTSELIEAEHFNEYTDIRQWVNAGDQLYTGVAYAAPAGVSALSVDHADGTPPAGKVLRWTGSTSTPFSFEEVGGLDGSAANLVLHKGRLFVNTWPTFAALGGLTGSDAQQAAAPAPPIGVWMSPLLGNDGVLTGSDAGKWKKVWQITDYEPDRVTAQTYAGGAIASYRGELYWGTMVVPGAAFLVHQMVYGNAGIAGRVVGTHRAAVIFRGDFTDESRQVEVLYGDRTEPVFTPNGQGGGAWSAGATGGRGDTPTGGGSYGPAGFGNPFNNYTWSMRTLGDHLFVGTMDDFYLLRDLATSPSVMSTLVSLVGQLGSLPGSAPASLTTQSGAPSPTPPSEAQLADVQGDLAGLVASGNDGTSGADLWRFDSSTAPAAPESRQGVGNYSNYGVRTMVADEQSGVLYVGTANPMNLMTSTTDAKPEGGWELIRLGTPASPPVAPPAPSVTTMSTRRLGGSDRFATAAEIAKASYPTGAAAAVLASGVGFADALSGAYLAGVLDAPTLLTKSGSLPAVTTKALADLGVHSVYVVGGPVAVADTVVDQLHKAGYQVVRVAGADRYGTAGKVAASDTDGIGRVGGLRTALLATGTAFPDALAGGPASYAAGLPLLLTRPDTLPAPTVTALRELGVQQVLVLGGPKAVTPGVASQLEQLGITVRRLQGADRAETAVAVARYAMSSLGFTNRHVHLARGDAYADALVAGPHAGKEQAVIVLTLTPTRNSPATLSFLHEQALVVTSADVLGGTAAVCEQAVSQAQAQTAH